MSENRTELSQLGEFGLINRLAQGISTQNHSTVMGIGDDAAVINAGDQYGLLAADMLVEGVHFDLSYVPLQHLGYKAISVNVSDIAAMNGNPEQVTVSLGLSNRFSVEAIEALYEGMKAAAKAFHVDIVGGDTTTSKSGLIISISVFGKVEKEKVTYRKGAKVGDILCATGDLGGAFMGLQVMEREKQAFMANPDMQPQLENYEYIVQRQLKPIARMDIIHELAEFGVVPTSMIDISDGLASECLHLSTNSGVGIQIYEDKIPIDRQTYETAVEFNLDPITCALNGGEDYELLFTIKQEDYDKIEKHEDIHFIGHTQELTKGNSLVTKNNNLVALKAQGWDHLNDQKEDN
ncbi:thiamine-phosphate kinase [Roseivirga echinicomitans]|uniref:Thiamine-monophosphate kinase n=1 Tax=Roseivirga echinicomitans TaxID=296218 RepID=A0A150XLB0_9BACT|nr:thiamine-phosphate kinase [Roseivirga echinicomitans]KYG79510.1 thiamine-monophosphate kinase [Roseivirga echinicomitans]